MTGEVTVPLLPCKSIDEMESFYEALGFQRTYRQTKPNPYVVMRREDCELHFFGMDGFDPAESYGSCIVSVPDVGALHAAFAAGLREAYGKVPVAGIPRMTRPRKRKNVGNLSGFTVVDPGGNWIRIFPRDGVAEPSTATSKLAKVLENAVVLGESKGDTAQAAKVLKGALSRETDATPEDRAEAEDYLAELTERLRGDEEQR